MSAAAEPADLLDRPAGEAARRLALAELERAAEARRALGAADDPEALHDFRVALRRLRSQLRAFRGVLGAALPKKLARRLRRLAAATGPGRDAEVGLDWLDRLGPPDAKSHAPGWRRLRERLEATHQDALAGARRDLVERFDRVARRLQDRLSAWQVDLRPQSAPEPFRDLVARELDAHRQALLEAFAAIESPSDRTATHRARLEAKRVRYLLDPIAATLPAAKPALTRLRALQDLLGELNDVAVLADEAGALAADLELAALDGVAAGARRPRTRARERPGLVALAEKIAAARAERWRPLAAGWLGDSAPERNGLDENLESVAAALNARATARPETRRVGERSPTDR